MVGKRREVVKTMNREAEQRVIPEYAGVAGQGLSYFLVNII
jgi:hypothetical protein